MGDMTPLGWKVNRSVRYVLLSALSCLLAIQIFALYLQSHGSGIPIRVSNVPSPCLITDVFKGEGGAHELHPGDVLKSFGGSVVEDCWFARHLVAGAPSGSVVPATVEREGRVIEVHVTTSRFARVLTPQAVLNWIWILFCWLVIAWLLWKKPRDAEIAFISLTGAVALTTMAISSPLEGPLGLVPRLAWSGVFAFCLILQGPLFLHWSLNYPLRITPPRGLLPFAYAVSLSLLAATWILFARSYTTHDFIADWHCLRAALAMNAIYVAGGLLIIGRTYRRALAPERRQQVKWFAFGLAIGLVPYTLLVILPMRVFEVEPLVSLYVGVACLFAIPFGFLASVIRYRLFDVDLIVTRGTTAVILLMCVALLRLLITSVTGSYLRSATASAELASAGEWLASALIVGVPAWSYRSMLDRPLGVPGLKASWARSSYRLLLSELRPPEGAVQATTSWIATTFQIERVAGFVIDPSRAAFSCVASHNLREWSGDTPSFAAEGSLADWLRAERHPVRTRAYDRPAGLKLLTQDERQRLNLFDTAVLVPLRVGSQLWGFLTISGHQSGILPNSVLVRLIGEIANELALSAERYVSERETAPPNAPLRRSTHAAPPPMTGGSRIGAYRLESFLGGGGSGEVWRAVHEPTGRVVALKRLRGDLGTDAKAFRRFLDEITALESIDDPNVVRILDCGNAEGFPWYAMALVEGETLRALLEREGALSLPTALTIAAATARGLAACHRVGVIHRDLSPSNILIAGSRALVADLGLLHRLPQPGESWSYKSTQMAGTILYMSPEQVSNRRLRFESDLFALGAILYEMLAGRPAFSGGSLVEIADRIAAANYRPLRDVLPVIPREVENVVASLLARDPAARPASAAHLARTLSRLSRSVESSGRHVA